MVDGRSGTRSRPSPCVESNTAIDFVVVTTHRGESRGEILGCVANPMGAFVVFGADDDGTGRHLKTPIGITRSEAVDAFLF
jgi:hypothetical protein